MSKNRPPDTIWAWDLLWVGLLAIYAFAGYPIVPFHGDESMQIFMSKDIANHTGERPFSDLYYSQTPADPLEQGLRIINGTVNKYTVGIAWKLDGFQLENINWPWYWDLGYQFNMENGFYPGDALLLTSRVPSALFLAASVVILFFATRLFAGRPAAYMAVAFYALNPAILVNGRRAMMEGSMLFGELLTVFAGLVIVRAHGWRAWVGALFLAIGAGIAVASKHTNVVTVFGVFLGCGLYIVALAWQERFRRFGLKIAQLIFAGILSIGVFLALNPAWWQEPIKVASVVLDERVALLEGQVNAFGGYQGIGEQLTGFYRQVFTARPMYFEVVEFQDPLAPQIITYEQTPYPGLLLPGISVPMFLAFLIGAAGLFHIIPLSQIDPASRWVIGTWAVVVTLFVLLATPLEWQRYYLPVMPVVAMLTPLGILRIVRLYLSDVEMHSQRFKGSQRVINS